MFIPQVVQVVPHKDYTVDILFHDGKQVLFDAKPLTEKGVFRQLADINVFLTTCTVMNNTLAWDLTGQRDLYNCLDIDPLVLYSL